MIVQSWSTRWIVLLVLVLGLTACQDEPDVSQTEEGRLVLGAVQQTDTLNRSIDLAARTLVLDGFRGTIRLDGTEDRQLAHFTFAKRARGEDVAAARRILDRVTLEEAGDAQIYQYVMRSRASERSAVDVRGTVPRNAAVRIQWESGTVALSNIAGPIRVRAQGGVVQVAGAGATVDVETRNSSMDVAMARLPDTSRVNLRTANGDLALTLPATTSAQVDARTDAGDINIDGLSFADRQLSPLGAGARFEGRLGTGDARVDLRTENGAIQLREGRVLRLPDPLPRDTLAADTVATGTTAADTTQVMPRDTTAAPLPADTTAPDTTTLPPADTTASGTQTSAPRPSERGGGA